MYSYYIPGDDDHLPQVVARTMQSRRAADANEPLMFVRLFVVVGIFFTAIAAFHQLVG